MTDAVKCYEHHRVTREGVDRIREPVMVEMECSLLIDGAKMATITASPNDLRELGYGFVILEGLVDSAGDIGSVSVEDEQILVVLADGKERPAKAGGTGPSRPTIDRDFIFGSLRHLDTEAHRRTSGAHSATILDLEGGVVSRGLDVRRRSAYDKAIGGALIKGTDLRRCVLLASGRQSREMVMRAAKVGIPITISKAAPISSGIEAAEEANMTLICFADQRKFSVFAGIERVRL